MPGAPDPLHAPPATADMSRRATFMTESAAASATAPGAAVAATTAAIIAMCFSMIHLIMQGQALHLAAKTCPHLDLGQNEGGSGRRWVTNGTFGSRRPPRRRGDEARDR